MSVITGDDYGAHTQFTGQWWFATQSPIECGEELDTADKLPVVDDDDEPAPQPTWANRPVCRTCGDPNFSLEKDRCISCRIGVH